MKKRSKPTEKLNNLLPQWAKSSVAVIFIIAIWYLAAAAVNNALLLPDPLAVAKKLVSLAQTGEFWQSIGASFLRVLSGFALGCTVGCVLAVAAYSVPLLRSLLEPIMTLLKSVPVASFIMLVILIFKRDVLPVFICFVMVTPILWSAVNLALDTVPWQYKELAQAYRLSLPKRVKGIYLPWILPHLAQGMLTALGFAWKSGIAAEVLCQPVKAIGTGIYEGKLYLETDHLFAWTVVVVILSLLLEKLLHYLLLRLKERKSNEN